MLPVSERSHARTGFGRPVRPAGGHVTLIRDALIEVLRKSNPVDEAELDRRVEQRAFNWHYLVIYLDYESEMLG